MNSPCSLSSIYLLGSANMVTCSRARRSALVVAGPEVNFSRAFACESMHCLQRSLPGMSGASQVRQQIANPICSIARRGNDMDRGRSRL